ncbi:MAG: galactose-1-phosphate uridylyltransferase [Methanomicrobiaceae archaeon]|uniref:Galactose-1-phosphate uridylyltransferase n=1 Tax=hydrocarbon metagenome TaxID=938273 RepID=A0A0W8FG68_9ZZZZ|nr:galactose-1-phosphate uridylyltransferase [Methanomicrobiaceae archaeon]MDD5419689.1 galactose-1-phosphate uridylyltransferase [Methanomicrobiaceae archaeon]
MFTIREVKTANGILQYRRESLTGIACRISPGRKKRHINVREKPLYEGNGCPFCPDAVHTATPTFDNGSRVCRGETVTFPNLYPYAEWHTVTVITRDHAVEQFTKRQLHDAFSGTIEALMRHDGYASINWNYLPTAGASMVHPHLQGLSDQQPPYLAGRYISAGHRYLLRHGRTYWEDLREREGSSERFLFGDEICWSASPVPLGEREVRGLLPVSSPGETEAYLEPLADGILRTIELYRQLGTHAFNVALFFDRPGSRRGFRAFCSIISRINPNDLSLCDTSFMERLYLEPIILTLPEELARCYREKSRVP